MVRKWVRKPFGKKKLEGREGEPKLRKKGKELPSLRQFSGGKFKLGSRRKKNEEDRLILRMVKKMRK